MIEPTEKGIRKCAEWLATCRRLGWAYEDLDFLELLWWRYHDRHGDLIQESKGK